jgi:hypothetical protein
MFFFNENKYVNSEPRTPVKMASGSGELFELWIEELYTYKKKRLETALLLIKLITV